MSKSKLSSNSDKNERPFEQTLNELEKIVAQLEDGELGLDEALSRYEDGIRLIKECQTRLQQVEQRVLVLTKVESEGQPILQPFRHEPTLRKV